MLGACARLGGQDLSEAVARGIDLAGLAEEAEERVDRLSGGMQRRLNLSAGLVHGPRLLLLDEPTAGVDPLETGRILAALLSWKAEGGSFLLSTHRMAEAEEVCDRVVFLHKGEVLEEGPVAEVLSRCRVKEAVHAIFRGPPPILPPDWPADLPVEVRKDRWVVSTSGSEGLARVAEQVGGLPGLAGLEPHRPDLGVRFLELSGKGLS